MIKLFATDLDGTLLKRGNIIQNEDIKAIHTLKELDIDFAVATGRMERDIRKVCDEINEPAHRISQNGAFVDTQQDLNILKKTFDVETSRHIHKAVNAFSNPFSITTQHENYISNMTPELKKLEQQVLYFPLVEGVNFIDKYNENFLPSKFMLLGEQHLLLPFQEEMNTLFYDQCETYISDTHSLDIVPKGVSKAAGLKMLAKHLHIKPEEMAVIGDSYNDIPMFEMTPHSFVMSTASKEVQQKASHVVGEVHEAIDYITDLKQARHF